ncbi:acyl-CoA dehydrogenase family member 11-like, partial [Python bivittatus]|uniref:Acyl-CoA dehydrogenase family member 11-like n=1 Tax=Python bivittatus TaxID=176946 RepID=A0A9F5IWP3_PYTBI
MRGAESPSLPGFLGAPLACLPASVAQRQRASGQVRAVPATPVAGRRSSSPGEVFAEVNVDLERFGARMRDEIDFLGRECELNPPRLQQFDAWGQRVDQIITCPAWKRMKDISAEESLVAEGYKRRYSSWSRVHQTAKLYLFMPSSGCYGCPLAMTDGAAKTIEITVVLRVTRGGTETIARELPDGSYSLHGFKWFTSATDSDMTLTLARIMAADGQIKQLDGARAHLISAEGQGIACIANMLNISRIYNAIFAVGSMRRIVHMARDYATKREAFGKPLKDHPLHIQTLARMEVQTHGAFLLMMETGRLLGLEETKKATEQDEHMLRLLTPVIKLYTAKQVTFTFLPGAQCFPTMGEAFVYTGQMLMDPGGGRIHAGCHRRTRLSHER